MTAEHRADTLLVSAVAGLLTWAAITLMTRRITHRQSRRTSQPTSRENDRR
ncbi:hypothetical protein ACIRL2_41640 [Embleya sp. NPDC127516]|uniref:hypothetical protein n=1 Tax=Embleya sp. NPDC127516 TaxID=3363990 RepID=UPI00380390D2